MNFFWLLELILSAAGSGSAFGMRIRIQVTNLMRIHVDPDTEPDPKHWCQGSNNGPGCVGADQWGIHTGTTTLS